MKPVLEAREPRRNESGLRGKVKAKAAELSFVFRETKMAVFIHGFAKNEKSNLSSKELDALKAFAEIPSAYSAADIQKSIETGVLIEVKLCGNQ